jgi:hypothetical protein
MNPPSSQKYKFYLPNPRFLYTPRSLHLGIHIPTKLRVVSKQQGSILKQKMIFVQISAIFFIIQAYLCLKNKQITYFLILI